MLQNKIKMFHKGLPHAPTRCSIASPASAHFPLTVLLLSPFFMQNILIVGFGFMGGLHAQAYAALPRARIIAIVDDAPEHAGKKAAALGVTAPIYNDFEQAVGAHDVDVVDICVPTLAHPRYIEKAIAAGKHVFCEKPFAATAGEAKRLARAARDSGIKMQIGHCIRFWPEYQALETYLRSEAGGRLRSLSLLRRSAIPNYSVGNWINDGALSGGGGFDLHIHDTDYIQHLFGTPSAVSSIGTKDASGWSHLFSIYHYDDIAVTAEGGWNYPAEWGFQMAFEAVFERAVIEFDSRATPTLVITEDGGKRRPMDFMQPAVGEANGIGGNISNLGGYFNELQSFLDCLDRNLEPCVATPEQAAESVRIVLAEIESAQTGQKVQL